MFILTKIADLVQIHPNDFTKPSRLAIEDYINAKYSNKVIQRVGLCICLYDLLSASEGLIGHGDGLVNINVEFRLLVFRPYKHTILTALITSSSASGISLRTPFFSDLFVPANALPAGAYFDSSQQHFVLRYAADTENDDDTILHYDMYDTVRVRVETEEWVDQAPEGPEELALDEEERKRRRRSPWSIQCSMMEDGLGPIQWWDSPEEEEAMRE